MASRGKNQKGGTCSYEELMAFQKQRDEERKKPCEKPPLPTKKEEVIKEKTVMDQRFATLTLEEVRIKYSTHMKKEYIGDLTYAMNNDAEGGIQRNEIEPWLILDKALPLLGQTATDLFNEANRKLMTLTDFYNLSNKIAQLKRTVAANKIGAEKKQAQKDSFGARNKFDEATATMGNITKDRREYANLRTTAISLANRISEHKSSSNSNQQHTTSRSTHSGYHYSGNRSMTSDYQPRSKSQSSSQFRTKFSSSWGSY